MGGRAPAVALYLMYSTCEFNCPLETTRVAQAQRLLGDRVAFAPTYKGRATGFWTKIAAIHASPRFRSRRQVISQDAVSRPGRGTSPTCQ
jgi:hypothetical protein